MLEKMSQIQLKYSQLTTQVSAKGVNFVLANSSKSANKDQRQNLRNLKRNQNFIRKNKSPLTGQFSSFDVKQSKQSLFQKRESYEAKFFLNSSSQEKRAATATSPYRQINQSDPNIMASGYKINSDDEHYQNPLDTIQ